MLFLIDNGGVLYLSSDMLASVELICTAVVLVGRIGLRAIRSG